MYQSQKVSQMKSYIFWAAMPSSYLSRFSRTSPQSVLSLPSTHLSGSSSVSGSLLSSIVRFIITKRLAFQSLFAKLRMASQRST